MKSPLIHIGYPKAASTWLQKTVFTNEALGYFGLRSRDDRTQLLQQIVAQHPLSYSNEHLLEYYHKRLEECPNPDLLPVLSAERFAGNIHSGGYDARQIAQRLQGMFPDSKVLIIIREQNSIITSSYQQYIREGGPYTLERYLHPPKRGFTRIPMFAFEYFEYDLITKIYQDLFGKDKVLVLPMEMLKSQAMNFVKNIQAFAGQTQDEALLSALPFKSKVNKGMGPYTIAWKRHFNRFFVDDRLNPGVWMRGIGKAERRFVNLAGSIESVFPKGMAINKKAKLRKNVDRIIGDHYQASNRRLQEITNVDLSSFNYSIK